MKSEAKKYIKQKPYIDDTGYYVPMVDYCEEGTAANYRCAITKEDFIKCYITWIENKDLPTFEEYRDKVTQLPQTLSEPKFKCPHCGGNVRKDISVSYMTYPPKYTYKCDNCEFSTLLGG